MNRKHLTVALVTGTALGLVVAPAIALAASSASTSPSTTPTPSMPTGLLASSIPKTVVLDPTTGAVVSVTLGEPADLTTASPDISSGTDCKAGYGCCYTPVVNGTYHDRSFYGSAGTFTGNWPRRNAWDSGNYTAYVCWESACSDLVGPNTYSTFGGCW